MTTDTTNPLPSITEPVIDRYRRWTPVWWRWIKPVLETVKRTAQVSEDNDVAITEINEVVDGINGRVGLQINGANRVVGMILLEGTVLSSTFSVLADKFIVVHPAADGTTIQAFITGLVNGVSTIGINGNLIVDGTVIARNIAANTITADKLSVSSLSAIAANVGTVTAGVLKSADNKFVIDLNNKTITMEA
jgi:hypothetical protein